MRAEWPKTAAALTISFLWRSACPSFGPVPALPLINNQRVRRKHLHTSRPPAHRKAPEKVEVRMGEVENVARKLIALAEACAPEDYRGRNGDWIAELGKSMSVEEGAYADYLDSLSETVLR